MRIIPPTLNSESGIEEDVDDLKARPIVILEPVVKGEEAMNKSNSARYPMTIFQIEDTLFVFRK